MYGAVIGDIIGSWYELHNCKSEDFDLFRRESHFTDDSVLTCAIAEAYYGEIPKEILDKGRFLLDSGLKSVLDEFSAKYCK